MKEQKIVLCAYGHDHPTNRHPTAQYCWEHKRMIDRQNYEKRQAKKKGSEQK